MKLFKKVLAGVAVAAALATSAYAVPITVGGVTWDPDSIFDFSSATDSIRQSIDPNTGIVSGFGVIRTINTLTGFCTGCELTFVFGGFTPVSGVTVPTVGGGQILYKNGFVNVYVDFTPETSINSSAGSMTLASTSDGDLWLGLLGHNGRDGSSFTGTVNLTGGTLDSLSGSGLLDVVGGLAASNLNTNTKADGADLAFSTSFTTFLPNGNLLEAVGTGNFKGDSVGNRIPEPESLALVGLGLMGLAVSRRRKSV